jgi:hypothetical protein
MLGEQKDGTWLMGLDLDDCINRNDEIEPHAVKVLDRFSTYSEVSPSGRGVKLFFLIASDDADRVASLFGRTEKGEWKTRKAFAVDEHREMAIDRAARYYCVTSESLEDWPETLRTVSLQDVRWFFEKAGPAFLEAHGVTETTTNSSNGRDESGSGHGFRFMYARKQAGDSFDEALAAILSDQSEAGEWARRTDQRELQRAWDRNSANPLHSWEDPDRSLLDDRRGKLPAFPLKALQSDKARDWVQRAAQGSGTSIEHVVPPFLGIASGLIGAARCVRPVRAWIEPMTCWAALVGYSGTRKTPGIAASRRALDMVENNQRDTILEKEYQHKQKLAKAKVARQTWERASKAAYQNGRRAPPMPDEASYDEKFIAPRLYVTDATVESLALQLRARSRGMIVIIEELARLFSNMQRYSAGSDSEFWLQAHDGDPWRQTRAGSASLDIPHLLIGLIGGLQPDKLAQCFKGPADGMYARFLFSWPDQPQHQDLSDVIDLVDPQIERALQKLAFLDDAADKKYVRLTKPALKLFNRLQRDVSEQMNTYFGREREWWSKVPKHVLRLAGTLAYVWWAFERNERDPEPRIESGDIENAVTIVIDFFWPHACAALRQIGLNDQHADARRVLHWLIATGKKQTSNEEVRRGPLGKRPDAATTQRILQYLQRAGWLRPYSERTRGRTKHRWEVNPKLLKS